MLIPSAINSKMSSKMGFCLKTFRKKISLSKGDTFGSTSAYCSYVGTGACVTNCIRYLVMLKKNKVKYFSSFIRYWSVRVEKYDGGC